MSEQKFQTYTLHELMEESERDDAERLARREWGHWKLDTSTLELIHTEDGYPIDLECITASAPMLDVIFQVVGKTWCSTEDAGHLIQAFEDIFQPQGRLCGCGIDKTIDASDFLKRKYTA